MGAGAGESREFAPERRSGERRKYNRRQSESLPTPPYYEAFDRIAGALEGIESLLRELVRQTGGASGAGWPDETHPRGQTHDAEADHGAEDG